jgi:hypothetical protein
MSTGRNIFQPNEFIARGFHGHALRLRYNLIEDKHAFPSAAVGV